MITEQHYTRLNEHPEDRIYRDREFIQRLQKHIDEVYEKLSLDLRLNDRGKDLLFDYLYNCDDDTISFDEFLNEAGLEYTDFIKSKVCSCWYHNE